MYFFGASAPDATCLKVLHYEGCERLLWDFERSDEDLRCTCHFTWIQ